MAVLIVNTPPRNGGGIAGRETDGLGSVSFAIALFNFDGTSWIGQTSAVPISRLWNFGASGSGERFAAAVVSLDYKLENRLPVPGPTVRAVTIFPANRLSFSSVSTSGGTIAGTTTDLATPSDFDVQLYRWDPDTAWSLVGAQAIAPDATWRFESVPASLQYVVVLIRRGEYPIFPGGMLAGCLPTR
jgi:hypothetical protein